MQDRTKTQNVVTTITGKQLERMLARVGSVCVNTEAEAEAKHQRALLNCVELVPAGVSSDRKNHQRG